MNHFELFNLPVALDIDSAALKAEFLKLQQQYHPDKAADKDQALIKSSEINQAFKKASETNFKGILDYTEDPIVSVDIIGNQNSCLFDAQLTSVIDKMVKIVGWYDNEIGYSSRLIDLITFVSKK